MKAKVDVLLVGIGGYGKNYLGDLLNSSNQESISIAGVVDIAPENCPYLPELKKMNVPAFGTIEEFYKEGKADLAIISTPIHFHCYQTCYALSHGSNVLCEKPVCATVQEALEIVKAQEMSGKFAAIGYQWSYSDAIQKLKKDIMEGVLGKPKRMKSIILAPRNLDYYSRHWAGKRRNEDGRWILDSVANNGTAHFLHNMLYVIGDSVDRSSLPETVRAELYRANRIENFDTSMIHARLENGVEIFFYASHATKESSGLQFIYEFENAVVTYERISENETGVVAVFSDGSKKIYGDPDKSRSQKLWTCIEAIHNGTGIPCGAEAAIAHTLCINGAQDSMSEIVNFPEELLVRDGETNRVWVEGLDETMIKCYRNWEMPGDIGVQWAKQGKSVDMRGYACFKG